MWIVESHGLRRTFTTRRGVVEAVAGVDLRVAEGEIVGFLGPNGAGKTTTFRMLTTLLRPTSGSATVAGADLTRDPAGVRRSIGFVPQATGGTGGGSDPNLTAREEVVLQGRLCGRPAREAARRAESLLGRLGLTGVERRRAKTLSGGQRRKLDIALGLVSAPRLLLLDEPSTGLDPRSRSDLWEHIRGLRDDLGTTVLLSTHYLDEADVLCDKVLIIDRGKVVAAGGPDELKEQVSGDIVTLGVRGDPGRALATLAARPDITEASFTGGAMRVTVPHGGRSLADMVRALDEAGVALTSVQLARPTLDDVFLTLTGREFRDDSPGRGKSPSRTEPAREREEAAR